MATQDEREEVEHYYKSNPSKPRAHKQYDKPAGPEHPHANVKVGKKEYGPTRADLEKEKERKFKVNFKIESDATAARLRQEKQDERAQKKSNKQQATSGPKSLTQKVGGWIGDRSYAIAHESRDIRPRRQSYGGSVPGSAIPGMGSDPFGIGRMPNPFAPPRSAPAVPRRRKRKKSRSQPAPRRRAPARSGGGGGMDMGIPKHMRWMF